MPCGEPVTVFPLSSTFFCEVTYINLAHQGNKKKCNLKAEIPFGMGTENIVGKGENAGYQHFLLFLQCFPKAFNSVS